MTISTSADVLHAWPERSADTVLPRGRWLKASGLALVLALAVGACLPETTFRARAVVAVADVASPLAAVLPKVAADAAMSEPVIARAAQSLIETHLPVREPGPLERIAVSVGLAGAHASSQEARLAADLANLVAATPGDVPGTVEIAARSPDATSAASIATALAAAVVSEQDETIRQMRRARSADDLALIDRLRAQAASARERLTALGGAVADPTQMRANAAAQTAAAQARVDTIRAIIASGTPPLSDRRDVPAAIGSLQTSYLEISRQLAVARETLGDRHTTIISLQDQLRRASASLTAEWRRLAHLADVELANARDREASFRKPDSAVDAARRSSIDDARRAVEVADEVLSRAESAQRDASRDEQGYHVLMRAAIPHASSGFSLPWRVSIAILSGLLVLLATWFSRPRNVARMPQSSGERQDERVEERQEKPREQGAPSPVANADLEDAPETMRDMVEGHAPGLKSKGRKDLMPSGSEEVGVHKPDDALLAQMTGLLHSLDAIDPAHGPVQTIMVAANELAGGTMKVALSLAKAAADTGYRVLVVEAARSRPELATAADPDSDPVLVDLFGELRVALRSEASDSCLFLAPRLEQGARIASALARQGDTLLIDDLAAEFDLIVIDGDRAADAAAAGWAADAYVRVGRFASQRDDDRFVGTFGASRASLLLTTLPAASGSAGERPALRPNASAAQSGAQPASALHRSAVRRPPTPVRMVPTRRKVGSR